MKNIKWLSLELTQALHKETVAAFGGSDGVRDEGLLEMALNRPLQKHHYEGPSVSIFELAEAYGFGFVKNHPFVDGNKRVGLLCIRSFLFLNGYLFEPKVDDELKTILQLAAGELGEAALAKWIQKNSKNVKQSDNIKIVPNV